MREVKHDLLTSKYTKVFHEEGDLVYYAPNHFEVWPAEGYPGDECLTEVYFQAGPIKEFGVNGVANEDLIAMVICRLESFQNSPYSCRENSIAITKLEEALLWLRKRTLGREQRGVEGTSKE
jgi:hypothetical protein